jgi:hypothetical protein
MASYGYLRLNDGILPNGSSVGGPLSFSIGLECSQRASSLSAIFSKTINRISPYNPMKSAKKIISEYAGCGEASMVRNRAIALSRMRVSISGETFRFRLPQ